MNWKVYESSHGQIKALSPHLPGWTDKNHDKPVRKDAVPAELQTDNRSGVLLSTLTCRAEYMGNKVTTYTPHFYVSRISGNNF